MAKRFTDDGKRIPTGVTFDKQRNKWRATYRGWSVKCASFEEAKAKRKELLKEGVPHPSYEKRKDKS